MAMQRSTECNEEITIFLTNQETGQTTEYTIDGSVIVAKVLEANNGPEGSEQSQNSAI